MITTDNTYTIDMPKIFNHAAKELTLRQSRIAGSKRVEHTGALSEHLAADPYTVTTQDGETSLMIIYPTYIRFVDMLFRKGKQKKRTAIYSKLVYGFTKGYIYSRTRGGIAKYIIKRLKETKVEI